MFTKFTKWVKRLFDKNVRSVTLGDLFHRDEPETVNIDVGRIIPRLSMPSPSSLVVGFAENTPLSHISGTIRYLEGKFTHAYKSSPDGALVPLTDDTEVLFYHTGVSRVGHLLHKPSIENLVGFIMTMEVIKNPSFKMYSIVGVCTPWRTSRKVSIWR